jgi:UDP-GlcNAc:undecaprenyl-phosphate/decaprenyl-phosphate GlcNAc-1-phosphate transferase
MDVSLGTAALGAVNPFFLLILAVPTSMLVIPLAWKLAPALGMLDQPDARKVHSKPIPRVGGWGIVAGALLPILVSMEFSPLVQSFVIGGVALFLFGLWDDAKQISHWPKFVGQIFATALVVYYGGLHVSHFPFVSQEIPPAIGKPFTVFALMGMINAINHSDGLDGLAGGETMLSLLVIAYLAYLGDDSVAVLIAFATMGGILGFLRYNTHPAQVFMGDSGSQFLGFTLGVLAVYLTQVAHPAVSPALPLLFLGLPISDIIVVLFKRVRGGMNWFKATRNHVHHRLLDLGFDHYETVVTIYSVQAALVILAVLLRYQSDWLITAAYFVIVGGLFAVLITAERKGWRRPAVEGISGLGRVVKVLTRGPVAQRVPLWLIASLLPTVVLGGALLSSRVPRDFGVVAGVLAAVTLLDLAWKRDPDALSMRLASYVAAIFSSYLMVKFAPAVGLPLEQLNIAVILTLVVTLGVFVRFTSGVRFGATPTDYLIGFGLVALLVFGEADAKGRDTVMISLNAIVLLYCCEALIGRFKGAWHMLHIATPASLLVLAIRGLS